MILIIILGSIAACFGLVVLFGAPYVPSLKPHMRAAFDLLSLEKGDLLLELGAGDGRVMLVALKRGYRVVGYELNPILALIAWLRTRRYGKRARVVWGDAFRVSWPDDTKAVYLFGVKRLVSKVDQRLRNNPGSKFVTVGFEVPERRADATKGAVHLYVY
jgi:hypothetical protein